MNTEVEIKPTIIYSSYTDAQKRATQKYRVANKDKVNERRKLYYQQRKAKDPEFLEYKRKKAREYYQRKKDKTEIKECTGLIDTVCDAMEKGEIFEPVIEPVIEENLKEVKPIVEEEVIIEPTITKVKKLKTIKAKSIKDVHSAEVIGIVHDGAILKLQVNGEDFIFQHDPTKAIKEVSGDKYVRSSRKRVNMAKFAKKIQ